MRGIASPKKPTGLSFLAPSGAAWSLPKPRPLLPRVRSPPRREEAPGRGVGPTTPGVAEPGVLTLRLVRMLAAGGAVWGGKHSV